MNRKLALPITPEEIKEATFQMGASKAAGPDGFNGLFYQKFWSIVNATVVGAAIDFSETGEIVAELNMTNIVLIPKVPNPEKVSQFRPISLCNYSYKILSKILANRLKDILPKIISHFQSAFVPGRQIQDNILIAHEAYHYLKLKKSGKAHELALKLDMSKAYDRVEWDFLEATLVKLGFAANWMQLLMACVRSVSLAVTINGKTGGHFHPLRGLRQGDPISPYLFLFTTDVFSALIQEACNSGSLSGIKLSHFGPSLSHLFFADDSLFFIKASRGDCSELMRIIDVYCEASGQLVNMDKSSVFFSPNTPLSLLDQISAILNVPVNDRPGHYLGLPTVWGRSKKASLAFVKDRLRDKIQSWKLGTLSMAGREVLIKSVALAVPTYPMNCFKFPVTLYREMDSLIAKFWWGQKEEEHKIHWKSWEFLGLSKLEGGMGFRNLNDFIPTLMLFGLK